MAHTAQPSGIFLITPDNVDPRGRVMVHDPSTNKVISGAAAPALKNLRNWMKRHPGEPYHTVLRDSYLCGHRLGDSSIGSQRDHEQSILQRTHRKRYSQTGNQPLKTNAGSTTRQPIISQGHGHRGADQAGPSSRRGQRSSECAHFDVQSTRGDAAEQASDTKKPCSNPYTSLKPSSDPPRLEAVSHWSIVIPNPHCLDHLHVSTLLTQLVKSRVTQPATSCW